MARKLPSNVEKADLIQVGLIAVAQAAMGFQWEGDLDSEAAREAFVRYARLRVRGAMLDELRSMDILPRDERRKVKVIAIARERWFTLNGREPTLTELGQACGMDIDEIASLEHSAQLAHTESLSHMDDDEEGVSHARRQPATPQDEVEARVATGMLLHRLEHFFAKLPEVERQVIDAYLGVGMTPVQLAASLDLSASRVAQLYTSVCRRLAVYMGHGPARTTDGVAGTSDAVERLIAEREAQEAEPWRKAGWTALLDDVLTASDQRFGMPAPDDDAPIVVGAGTRWG